MTVDTGASLAYFLNPVGHRLTVFDLETHIQRGELFIEGAHPVNGNRLLKVGADGLAFISEDGSMRLYRSPLFAGGD